MDDRTFTRYLAALVRYIESTTAPPAAAFVEVARTLSERMNQPDQALSWLQSSASQNKPDAQFVLGYLYEHGKGLPLDFSKAAENYRRAALQGYSPAEMNLGALYRHGDGVPKKYPAFHETFYFFLRLH